MDRPRNSLSTIEPTGSSLMLLTRSREFCTSGNEHDPQHISIRVCIFLHLLHDLGRLMGENNVPTLGRNSSTHKLGDRLAPDRNDIQPADNLYYGVSREIRREAQEGITRALASFSTATVYERSQLNDLVMFYRNIVTMTRRAGELETGLSNALNRNRPKQESAPETAAPRVDGGNADPTRIQEESGEPDPPRSSGITLTVFNNVRPEGTNLVRESKPKDPRGYTHIPEWARIQRASFPDG